MGLASKLNGARGPGAVAPTANSAPMQPGLEQQPPPPYSTASLQNLRDKLPQQNQNHSHTDAQRAIQPGVHSAPYLDLLQEAIAQNKLQAFFPSGDPRIAQIAVRAERQVEKLARAWHIPREIAADTVRLALYDVIIYIDDSGSMAFEENGERIRDLELILERVAHAATLFDEDGIDIRFMNDDDTPLERLENVRTADQVTQIMANRKFSDLTPFGTKLRQKVIDGIVLPKLRQRRKPVLVIGITDGQPAGEHINTLEETMRYAIHSNVTRPLGPGAVAFQFAQVGNDQKATKFLDKLDKHPDLGSSIDCTSNYENESAQMARAKPPVDLTPELWFVKLILGAIHPEYDAKDE